MSNEFLEYASDILKDDNTAGQAEVAAAPTPEENHNQDLAEGAAEGAEQNDNTAPANEEPAEAPATTEEPAEQAQPQFDWKSFEEQSEGLVKDEESFKTVVSRAKQYEELEKAKTELEKNQFKPANSFVETLNKLTLDGATQSQINAFVNLSTKGDLSKLDPLEAKVTKMVLVDGYNEDVARKIVERNFPLSEYDEGSEDRVIIEEELRVSAKQDLEALSQYQTKITTVENPEKEAAEQARLAEIATKEQYQRQLTSEVPKIVSTFPKKFDFEVEVQGEKLPFSVNVDANYPLQEAIKGYFEETGAPFNQESVKEAFNYVYADYVAANLPSILAENAKRVSSHLEEKISNKYENRSGLPQREATINTSSTELDDKHWDFLNAVAEGKTN